jgi:HEAT repeat protein
LVGCGGKAPTVLGDASAPPPATSQPAPAKSKYFHLSPAEREASLQAVVDGKSVREWIAELEQPWTPGRDVAARALAKLGPRAVAAVPALAEGARNGSESAVAALGAIGPAAAPALHVFLHRIDRHPVAYDAVLRIGPAAAPYLLEELAQQASEEQPDLTFHVIFDLMVKIQPTPLEVVPTLIDWIQSSKRPMLQTGAMETLPRLGAAGKAAAPALRAALKDPALRVAAGLALCQLDLADAELVAAARGWLAAAGKDQEIERVHAAYFIARGDPTDPSTIPILIEAVQSVRKTTDADYFSQHPILFLGELGPRAKSALPALEKKSRETRSDFVLRATAIALLKIDFDAELPIVCEVFAPESKHTQSQRTAVIEVLAGYGPKVRKALPTLQQRLNMQDPGEYTYRDGVRLLRQLDESACIAMLIDHVDTRTGFRRSEACTLLGEIGPAAKAAVPALTRALQHDDPALQRDAKDALQRIQGTK